MGLGSLKLGVDKIWQPTGTRTNQRRRQEFGWVESGRRVVGCVEWFGVGYYGRARVSQNFFVGDQSDRGGETCEEDEVQSSETVSQKNYIQQRCYIARREFLRNLTNKPNLQWRKKYTKYLAKLKEN